MLEVSWSTVGWILFIPGCAVFALGVYLEIRNRRREKRDRQEAAAHGIDLNGK